MMVRKHDLVKFKGFTFRHTLRSRGQIMVKLALKYHFRDIGNLKAEYFGKNPESVQNEESNQIFHLYGTMTYGEQNSV